MLQSMKQIGDPRKKTDPKKKVRTLSVEELAKSIKYPGSKTPVKKEIDLVKVRPFKPANPELENTFEGVAQNIAYEKQRESDISERESEDYGRNTPKGQTPYYDRQEMMDQLNKPSIKKSIEYLRAKRAKMEEDYKAKAKPKSK